MIIDINDSGKVVLTWIERELLPKLKQAPILKTLDVKPDSLMLNIAINTFFSYNAKRINELTIKGAKSFTLGSDTLDLDLLKETLLQHLEGNKSIRVTELFPTLDNLVPYSIDKDDIESLYEIGKEFRKD